jgi:hypothetical protein
MTPRSFDPQTSREMVGDERARTIEAKARQDADSGIYSPPEPSGFVTYWGQAQDEFARAVYAAQWGKRKARNERKAAA